MINGTSTQLSPCDSIGLHRPPQRATNGEIELREDGNACASGKDKYPHGEAKCLSSIIRRFKFECLCFFAQ